MKHINILVFFFLIASCMLISAPTKPAHSFAGAQQGSVINGFDMMTVGRILQRLGLSYQPKSDRNGNPQISVTSRDLPSAQFDIYFFNCNAMSNCESITLWSWYRPSVGINYSHVNVWNKRNRWVRGYLDGDFQPVLEMDVHALGGLGEQNLYLMINAYVETMKAYATYMKVDKEK